MRLQPDVPAGGRALPGHVVAIADGHIVGVEPATVADMPSRPISDGPRPRPHRGLAARVSP